MFGSADILKLHCSFLGPAPLALLPIRFTATTSPFSRLHALLECTLLSGPTARRYWSSQRPMARLHFAICFTITATNLPRGVLTNSLCSVPRYFELYPSASACRRSPMPPPSLSNQTSHSRQVLRFWYILCSLQTSLRSALTFLAEGGSMHGQGKKSTLRG